MNRRLFLASSGLWAMGIGNRVEAATVNLTVEGDIAANSPLVMTDADLLALDQIEFQTHTLWTSGTTKFAGPSLFDILQLAKAGPGSLQLTALNGYIVEMPRSLVTPQWPIVANRINAEPFSLREKGPFWVMFPFDDVPELQDETVYGVSVWQLSQITVLKS